MLIYLVSATLRLCDFATLRLCDFATLRLCVFATLRLCDSATYKILPKTKATTTFIAFDTKNAFLDSANNGSAPWPS